MEQHQDKIKFTLSAEETVVNTTVKVIATISALMTDRTEDELKSTIREMMNSFIPEASWQYSGMTRSQHSSGVEEVKLLATARVSESENHALLERAVTESRKHKNLGISNVQTDTSFPATLIDQTEQKLRLILLARATEVMIEMNNSIAQHDGYHVKTVKFAPQAMQQNLSNAIMMASAGATKMSYGSGFSDDNDAIGNAQKFTMVANVTLARRW